MLDGHHKGRINRSGTVIGALVNYLQTAKLITEGFMEMTTAASPSIRPLAIQDGHPAFVP